MGISFVSAVLAAQYLPARDFVLISLVWALAPSVAAAGAGIDSAVVRLMASRSDWSGPASVRAAGHRLALQTALSVVVSVYFAFSPEIGDKLLAVLLAFNALACGLGLNMISLWRPQAEQDSRGYVMQQMVGVMTASIPALCGTLLRADVVTLLFLVTLGGGSATLFRLITLRRGLMNPGDPTSPLADYEYRRLASTLVGATFLYSVLERIDLAAVSRFAAAPVAAEFAAGQRLATGLALLATVIVITLTVPASKVRHSHAIRGLYDEHRGLLCAGAGGVLLGCALFPMLAQAAFPLQPDAGASAAIYGSQYLVIIAYMPAVLTFPHIGHRRWQVELPMIVLAAELSVLMVLLQGPELGAVAYATASPVAHAVGLAYVIWRLRSSHEEEGASVRDGVIRVERG